jgi:TonB family protein
MFGWNEAAWYSILIGVALKSTVVLGAAWLLAFLLRTRSAAVRHLVWTAAAAAVLALPFLSVALPALRIPVTSALFPSPAQEIFHATGSSTLDTAGLHSPTPGSAVKPLQPAGRPPGWRIWLMLAWAAGSLVALAQMMVACAVVWRERRSARPFSDRALCGALSGALGIHGPVEVLETEAGRMPMTFGLLRSAIFMPSDVWEWSDERRRIVLLHELAHVRRGDVATHWLARTALTVYWWNPLAWMAWREFLKERERATDDLVLNTGARASEYAGHLLEVARTMQTAPAIGWAAVAMARRSQLEGRLLAILDSGVNRKAPGRAAALMAALLAVGIIAPLAAVRAQETKAEAIPADVDATIRVARAEKNYESLENAAKATEQARKYDTAYKLLEAAIEIRAGVSGEQSVEHGVGLLKLADLERKRHENKSAEDLYARAAQILGNRPEAARALVHLGLAAITKKDFQQATDDFQHALRVDPDHAGLALMWMAVVRQAERNVDQAEALYQKALALQDPKSPEAATILKVYAQFLQRQGRTKEAGELDARATAVQKANAKPTPAASAGVYRVGAGVAAPKVLSKVDPEYTDEARAALIEGTEVVTVEIGPDGLAHNGQVLQGLGLGLDESGLDAISQWHFQPGIKDGQPVTVMATIEINWRLL